MKTPKGRICPWVGCGGTIVSADRGTAQGEAQWACNVCGEMFVSLEGYREKLRKESDWAKTWIEWSHEQAAPEPVSSPDEALTTEAS